MYVFWKPVSCLGSEVRVRLGNVQVLSVRVKYGKQH